MTLGNKKIVLCVTGSIAAYKAATLTSMLTKAGAHVDVLMTDSAKQFIGPATFQALSRHPVNDNLFIEKKEGQIAHIDLADQADLFIVAPASSHTLSKLAQGEAGDMVSATVLATKAPVWIAPAMNVNMYQHPAVQANIKKLISYGYRLLEPDEGYLACGWVGKGRLLEPDIIFSQIESFFSSPKKTLDGKKVLLTAGPTRESFDPVRYFTNYSSGKMGYSLAHVLQKRGAEVTLISGPTYLKTPEYVTRINVTSAIEMFEAVMKRESEMDAVIMSAAVADYRPKEIFHQKMKKQEGSLLIEMVRNPDILLELGKRKDKQILIGFAAETEHLEDYAKEKLRKKNLDMIVANNIAEEGSGFEKDTNKVCFYYPSGRYKSFELMTKHHVSEHIVDALEDLFKVSDLS
ncbi:bifunctional phosphopantothenoylcysteine decarboxylase/phosphopantothenate--cysteine ligase CoaBC [Terrilactibacillus sp. BCM23-1]|uniref:Coenzyme A biosynthesis bifunctional protein CoaBC n=1 Tax=Terrilactibacillus tamarindi TaxID=2599694 RepID=A0A6N8CTG3_9BACI|nr:bifunctional phosphopantothenoylcysteine decarboxylase/phosphopantothenate--cysteine ligase CoaBC [Terrilactibacillus tamarindi]MTT32323.1 bifunctional phosphopantothenoylcysteine decarboxylase/phosphopantothenate--cysteine ligase CoaBC [Terrilactibacillus tamarindi]